MAKQYSVLFYVDAAREAEFAALNDAEIEARMDKDNGAFVAIIRAISTQRIIAVYINGQRYRLIPATKKTVEAEYRAVCEAAHIPYYPPQIDR